MNEIVKSTSPQNPGELAEDISFDAGQAAVDGAPVAGVDDGFSSVVELAGGRNAAGRRALRQVFSRLEKVLDAEVELLQQGRTDGLDEIAQRKSQCLSDLARLSRALNIDALLADAEGNAFKEEVARIRAKLSENEATLKFYLEAAREVATMVAENMRIAESDGTYAESGPFGRYGR